jgi:hypothetical protein
MRTGHIKIYSPETGCGVIQADSDSRVVLFFCRPCIVAPYTPTVGDAVCFQVRTSPISGQPACPDHATDQGTGVTADANLAPSGFPQHHRGNDNEARPGQ